MCTRCFSSSTYRRPAHTALKERVDGLLLSLLALVLCLDPCLQDMGQCNDAYSALVVATGEAMVLPAWIIACLFLKLHV